MYNTCIYINVYKLSQLHRASGTPEDRFIADQLERVAGLLRFTGATTAEKFHARVECNEEWIKEEMNNRGWSEGRQSFQREITHSPYLTN